MRSWVVVPLKSITTVDQLRVWTLDGIKKMKYPKFYFER